MKKIITVISVTVLFILLSGNIKASAVTADNIGYYIYIGNDNYYYINPVAYNFVNWTYPNNTDAYFFNYAVSIGGNYGFTTGPYNTLDNALDAYSNFISNFNYKIDVSNTSPYFPENTIYIVGLPYRGNQRPNANYFPTEDDFDDYLNPDASWYEEMWNTLKEELGNPAFWFGQWFIDLIDNIYGNEDDPTGPPKPPNSTHVQINNPTLTPAPTPIPYSTVVIPKTDPVTGDTYYETNYYYNNPSGTPIVQPYPPTQPPATGSPSGGDNYIPVGGDPYSIPVVNWLTSVTIGDTNYDGIDSVASGLDSIDTIGSDYNDGMSAVQDSTGTLPTSWLLLIGVAAAIPLIAGLISRFLS